MPPMKRPPTQHAQPFGATLSVAALAKRWGTSGAAIRRLLGTQQLDFVQIQDRIRIPLPQVEHLEEAAASGAATLPGRQAKPRRRKRESS